MRRRRTAWSASVAAVGVLALVASCGGGSGSSSGSSESGGTTTVEWSMWAAGADEQKQWKHVANLVHEKYPNIKVKLRTSPFADYFTKLKTQMAGGQAPCIVTMQSLRLPAFAQALEPLDAHMKQNDFQQSKWNPAALGALQFEGKQLGMPYGFSTMLMYYNKDAFTKAGVPEPKPGWTMADFEQAAKQLDKPGRPGFGMSFSDLHMFSMLASYNGARPVSEDGKLQVTAPKMRKAFSWYTELATKQKVASVPASSSDVPWGEQQFVAGNVPMAVDGTWNLGTNIKSANFDVGVAPLPAGPGGGTTYVADSGFAVSQACGNKDAAYKAISVLTGPKAQSYLAGLGRAYPALKDQEKAFEKYLSSEAVTGNNPELVEQIQTSMAAGFDKAVPFLGNQDWDQVTKLTAQNFLPAYTGSVPPEKALETVQQRGGQGE